MSEVIGKTRPRVSFFRFPALFSAKPKTIRFRILSLVSLIVLPLILLFAWSTLRVAGLSRQNLELQRADITNRVSSAIDRDIAGIIGMLTGLSGAGDLQKQDLVNFKQKALVLARQPHVVRLWAFDKSGTYVAGTGTDPVDFATISTVAREIFTTGRVVVSGVTGEGPDHASAIIATPVRDANRVVYGLAAELRIAQLSNVFSEKGMESNWVAAVVDRDGRYVARSLDTANRLGKVARPELGQAARNTMDVGLFENVTYEGVRMLNAYRRSPLTNWTTVVAVPQEEFVRPIRQLITFLALTGLSILAGTLVMSSLLAARISRPVRDLTHYANSLATGVPYNPSPHPIVELEEVRAALDTAMARSARLAALVASSGDAIMSVDLDGTIQSWNRGAEELLGYSAEEIIGRPKTAVVPDDRVAEYHTLRDEVLSGEGVRAETERLHKDGSRVHVSLDMAPIRRPNGTIFAISSIIHDISDRKAAEAHKTFLMHELAHRSKNQLAIIQAIAKQTARRSTSTEAFLATFGKRIQGLSASHDLLAAQNWRSVPLAELLQSQLSVFVKWPSERVTAKGPAILLTPSSAEAIGLALHELATNSAKYGALSVAEGRIDIKWQKIADDYTPGRLTIDWQELNGPLVEVPKDKGFGSQIIESMVAQTVDGTAQIEYAPEGVRWHLECPLENVSAGR